MVPFSHILERRSQKPPTGLGRYERIQQGDEFHESITVVLPEHCV